VTITKGFKPEEFERLLQINDACYEGVERPSIFEFENMLKYTDVFLAKYNVDGCNSKPEEDIIIGFAIVRPTAEPYLWSIAVDPEFRGRLVGETLLKKIIKIYTLDKRDEITLHCRPDNPAQKLYFNVGFRVEGIARHWYGRNAPGLFMRRPLP
jgi:ribosomal protein S18 acetylase RimI-like enzyme